MDIVAEEKVIRKIFWIRDQKVILDSDVAELYRRVATKRLNEQVSRNKERFSNDFMFRLTQKEFSDLRSQIATSSLEEYGGRRYTPFVFTELGVAMLASVLRSNRAIKMNIAIVRAFAKLRYLVQTNEIIFEKIKELEDGLKKHQKDHTEQLKEVYETLNRLIIQEETPKEELGFNVNPESYKKKTK
ncbi:ORF6N domain-containing protein [Candidatus Dojkabacteria bacterium]|nr:ORF6N domain-containing protein [Candidatus Dojkabacteria bacterium]